MWDLLIAFVNTPGAEGDSGVDSRFLNFIPAVRCQIPMPRKVLMTAKYHQNKSIQAAGRFIADTDITTYF